MTPLIRKLKAPEYLSTSPVASRSFPAGTRVCIGARAGNRDYLIAFQAKEPGSSSWQTLSCYATVRANNLEGGWLPPR